MSRFFPVALLLAVAAMPVVATAATKATSAQTGRDAGAAGVPGLSAAIQVDGTTLIQAPVSIAASQDLVLATVLTPRATVAPATSTTSTIASGSGGGATASPTGSGTSGSGTSAVSAAGVQQLSGGLVAASTPTPSQATFVVAGQDGQSISVAVPQNFDVTRSGGSETLNVATTTDLTSLAGSQLLATSIGGGAGTLSFNVGGRINIGQNVVPGAYEGLLVVTAQYN